VLVTGGNGFVGSHVVEKLLDVGYNVRCLLRRHSQPQWIESLPVDIQRVDYFDANELRGSVSGVEAVFHFAGATKAKDEAAYFRANAETTRCLIEAAADACPDLKLFLLCSSQAALGPSPTLDPLAEESPPQPLTAYGRSKLEAENICREFAHKIPVTVVRPPAVYGPRDRDILIFFKAVWWGFSPRIGREARYLSLVSAMDVARISRLILERKPDGFRIYHVTDGDVHTWDEVSQTIAQVMGRRPVRITVPVSIAAAVGRLISGWSSLIGRTATLNKEKINEILQPYWLMSSQKAEVELDYHPKYKLQAGIKETVRWYIERGWL
jgi:nucleoside-diphosphate-sugar epimerase